MSILKKDKLTEEGKIYLDKIISSSKRMQAMINDLLAISTISGNHDFETLNLNAILGDVLQTLEYRIDETKAEIQHDILPEISGIPSQFRQLFQNLISNALKFSKEGVRPIVRISYKYVTPAEVVALQSGKRNDIV